MIAIKRRCEFFDTCQFANSTSVTCTENAGGNYCGVYRILAKLQKECDAYQTLFELQEEKEKKRRRKK
jgi:hypothetical protein